RKPLARRAAAPARTLAAPAARPAPGARRAGGDPVAGGCGSAEHLGRSRQVYAQDSAATLVFESSPSSCLCDSCRHTNASPWLSSPWVAAHTTAAVLLAAPSLVIAFLRWKFTVSSAIARMPEISLEV